MQHVSQCALVRSGRAAVAAYKPPCLSGRDQLVRIDVRERRDPEAGLADQLGHRPTRAEGNERTEDRILRDPGQQFRGP